MCLCTSHLHFMILVVHFSTLTFPYYLQMHHVHVQCCTFHFRLLRSVLLLWTKIFTTPCCHLLNVHRDNLDGRLLSFLLMRALRRVVTWLLTVKTMDTRLTSVRRSCCLWGRSGSARAGRSMIVVGGTPSFLAYVLWPVVPLVIS